MSDFLKVYGPILALIAVGFVVVYQFVDPAPPLYQRRAGGRRAAGFCCRQAS